VSEKDKQKSTRTVLVNYNNIDEVLAEDDLAEFKARFVATIEKSAFIGTTAKSLGLKESTIYRWMRDDPEFANEVRHAQTRHAEEIGRVLIDKAKSEKDTQALIFLCKTLGKNLGFDEKMPAVNINIGSQADFNVAGLSIDDREQLLTLIRKSKQQESAVSKPIEVQEVLDILDDGTRGVSAEE
jgi:hypothetical protein